MMKQFTDKVVLITGGNSGIGKATALAFAELGAKVAIAGRRIKEGEETVNLIKKAGSSNIFIPTDITQETEVKNLISQTRCWVIAAADSARTRPPASRSTQTRALFPQRKTPPDSRSSG
jgi:NAD(P)-dependent dehydrogenase (short-subunit alcohol dehydrogenase family)